MYKKDMYVKWYIAQLGGLSNMIAETNCTKSGH